MGDGQPTQDELQRRLTILERTLAELAGAGASGADLAPFRQQADTVRQLLIGAGVQAGRDVDVGGDVVRDKIGTQINTGGGPYVEGNLIVTADSPPEDLLAAYYRCVAAECSRLPLGVIDNEFLRTRQGSLGQGEQDIPLPDIYVGLDVVAPAQERGKNPRAWALQLARGEGKERTALLDALSQPAARRAVLLGDAGTGKTTFVNYLAYLLAADPDRLPAPLRGLLLVRLVLREVAARHLPPTATQGTAEMLWNALADDVASHLGKPLADKLVPYLQSRLLAEGGFILLDGLDEVPEARQRREVLIEAVAKLTQALPKGKTRVLVTARPYAYADPRWQLAGFATLALAPFNEGQVDRFIERWYQTVRIALGWNPATAAGKGAELRAALHERAYLGDLASRPLLLTLMATLHSSWGKLPEDRADLYEETVKLLLSRWQRAREVRRPDGELELEPSITQALGVGEARLRAALERLAYAVQQRQRAQPEREAAPADITEADLLVAFKPLLGEVAPDTLLGYLRDRAGLLVAREDGVYAFPHRTFQEYLAACHLADQPDFAVELKALACADPAWWREVCLLGIGKARRGGVGQAAGVVNVLLPEGPEEVASCGESHWQLAVLAGTALTELRLREQAQGHDHYAALLRRARRWLVQLVEGGHLSVRERAEAGDVLGQLGDPRPGVATITIGETEAPDILWVRVPAGPFTMGSSEDDKMAYADERPAHTVILPEFYISRYPITNAQYAPFIAAGGYDDEVYWTPEGWAWRQGAEADLSPIDNEDYRRRYADWLKNRPREKRDRPYWWGDSKWSKATRPVVGVSWYEALAYCTWLRSRLAQVTAPLTIWHEAAPVVKSVSWQSASIRLPSEVEWEKAARGDQGLRWPWSKEWREDRANTEEAGLGETSAVGVFPGGASPFGVLDMSGNVWEWTRSRWGRRSLRTPDYGYPYQSDDGREEPGGPDWRVVRGGSWSDAQGNARCAVRYGSVPVDFYDLFGLRVVVSITPSQWPAKPDTHGCGPAPQEKKIARPGPGRAGVSPPAKYQSVPASCRPGRAARGQSPSRSSPMKRWLLLILLLLLLAALALTVRGWLPPLLAFVGANTDLIQGLQAAAQIVLWLGVALVALFSYLTGRRQVAAHQERKPQPKPDMRDVRQTLNGTGVQAARDVKVERDLVTGDKISSQINTGGGAYVGGNIRVRGDLVGRDQILTGDGNILTGGGNLVGRDLTIVVTKSVEGLLRKLEAPLPQAAAQQATEAYYGAVIDRHRYLGFRGMGVSDRIPLRLPLLDLYVPLKARVELPPGDTWRRDISVAGRQLPAGADADLSGRLSEPVLVLDLLQKNDGLIILGDPGAGKTTFLKYLALKLALGEGGTLGLGDRLPVLAPLSEYANMLGASRSMIRLDDFITQHLHDCGADGAVQQIFAAALAAGRALILLDGLDEVKDLRLRETVVKQVAAFYAFQRRKGNKFVVTSRIVGYREARLSAELPSECTLIDFDNDEIAAFVARWTAALERQAQGEGAAARTDAARERRELLDAIHRNPSVRRLAANPLLLTILAMMKRQGVTLPERRVELYDQYVTILLSTWNRARGLGRSASHDLDVVQTVRVLAPLALWMHEVNPGVGLVKREDLRRRLIALYTESGEPQPDRAARQFLEDVREHAGLLLERGPEEYGFIHLTFEEYLAAVAIALEGQGDCRPIFERLAAHVGDPAWREVAQLTVGYVGIRQQLPKVAGGVVEALAAEQPGAPGEAVVLAGEAVLDAWPGGVPPESKAKVIAALVGTMQAAAVPAPLRRRAGLLLGRLGWLSDDLDDFVPVPAGEFVYGNPGKRVKISNRYWIAKYPVTNAQYDRFIKDKGYERQELWSTDGWAWRNGAEADLSFIKEKELKEAYQRWLAGRPQEKRHQPFGWDDPENANPIFPVVGVTWFEAEAYANWLNMRLAEFRLGEAVPTGYRVRLATEEEWERAARDTDGREYPWRGGFDSANANVAEGTGKAIGVTAVCTYPQGVSPAGAWDMSGNVWEWTHSLWSSEEARRVVRGGSWSDNQWYARCAVRDRYGPDNSSDFIGLRVVVSLSF